ncbi:MAG: pyridoxine 5'-phosphate synthase [Gammaproteobacteria bacterium]|nr:MAG: pyridoxine 5'-phosphate synthase [Gammaproteobacteria bacterium]
MIALSVNVNKIALLRNSRGGARPDLLELARMALLAGAHGITVHPRPDQRHIRASDVPALAAMLRAEFPDAEFNIEGNPFAPANNDGYPGLEALVAAARPAQVTLVPDGDVQLTSDHGWDLPADTARLRPLVERMHAHGARVSLFMDPDPAAIAAVPDTGAERIELYTGPFAHAYAEDGHSGGTLSRASLEAFIRAAQCARDLELGVNAGHDLDLDNLVALRTLPGLAEVSIGHALVADALELGWFGTVHRYLRVLNG